MRVAGSIMIAAVAALATVGRAQQPPPPSPPPQAPQSQPPQQQPPQQQPVQGREQRPFKSGVEIISIVATVLDAEGHFIKDLPREAFEVYEDGRPQPITQFSNQRVPVSVGVLLDISDSMFGQRIRDARGALAHFLFDLLGSSDEYFLLTFNHEPHIATEWTTQRALVDDALTNIRPHGGTAIYDAVLKALPVAERRSRPRAALLIISDGADTASDATLREVRSTLLRSDVFAYAIAIDSPSRQPINTRVSPEALAEITNPSGGRTEVIHNNDELVAATARIADELNSQYLIGYSPPRGADGQYHSIHVRVQGPGYRARARNGYVAAPLPSTRN